MKRYLLDTGIVGDYVNRRLGVRERVVEAGRQRARVGICVPVLGELVAGVLGSNAPQRHLRVLKRGLGTLRLWPYDRAAAYEFGRLQAELRRVGRPMQQIDIQIAAIALTLGNCTVVTKDGDLGDVPGLDVEDWSTPA